MTSMPLSDPPILPNSPAEHSSGLSTAHALASSSLLPKFYDNQPQPSHQSPLATTVSIRNALSAINHKTFDLPTPSKVLNSGTKRISNYAGVDSQLVTHTVTTSVGNSMDGQVGSVNSDTTLETLAPRNNIEEKINTARAMHKEMLIARQLCEGGYGLKDDDLSQFLRDNRRFRHGIESERDFLEAQKLFLPRKFNATGSSLADLSSTSTTLSRIQSMNDSARQSQYSCGDDPIASNSQPNRRLVRFLVDSSNTTPGTSSGYTSLGQVQSKMEEGRRVFLVSNESPISADDREVQRTAGFLLLAFGVLTYLVGGWTLIHSMGEGGPLATTAMAEVTRTLVKSEAGVVCCVHPVDAAMARAIERGVLAVMVVGVVAWLAVLLWAAAAF
jgi:hypothetical protein